MSPIHHQSLSPIRVLLVDDCELVRKGVRAVLSAASNPAIEVIGESESAADALVQCERHQPDVVVLEANLPDAPKLELCRQIAARHANIRMLVLTSSASQAASYECVIAGAHGCLGKEIRPAVLVDAVHDVAWGGSIFDPAGTANLANRSAESKKPHLHDLSVQQRRVLELLTAGHTNEEIAAELRLSKHTVRNYLVATFRKLGVKRRAQASALFMQQSQDAALAGV